ncbi:hypothetical protein [Sphingomonas sp. PB4P5]|uniref:hypothetical protein n=1 Tax=Parasphingomonas puruogangriensis TaxID=3096155 RepID=UPI002FC7D9F3
MATGFNPDTPIAGHYRMRLRSGGVLVGIRIWFGAPLDPIDGSELDRAPRWQVHANGEPIALDRVWPKCAADPIDEAEYRFQTKRQQWAEANAPLSPIADPRRRADPLDSPILF